MSTHLFIKFDGIKGESQADGHKDEIEVLSWNHSFNMPTHPQRSTAGGATVEQANHADFTFTKFMDSASDDLLKKLWQGTHIKTAVFQAYRASGEKTKGVPYLKIEMSEGVLISSFSVAGGEGGVPMESVSLNYGKIVYTYTPQDQSKGAAGAAQPVGHDLVKRVVS